MSELEKVNCLRHALELTEDFELTLVTVEHGKGWLEGDAKNNCGGKDRGEDAFEKLDEGKGQF